MKQVIFLIILYFVTFGVSNEVLASTTLQADFSDKKVGEQMTLSVFVDTKQESLNALELSLLFTPEVLRFVSSNDRDSVVGLWVEKPALVDEKTIRLSGISPSGFISPQASIISLLFTIEKPGLVTFTIEDSRLLLNDGLGTVATVTDQSFLLNIVTGSTTNVVSMTDTELPEHFTPEIIFNAEAFNGRATLVFLTRDTESGLKNYEVKEGFFGHYVRADSPYDIKNQNLDTTLYIKAIDLSGNERIEIIYPQNWKPWYESIKIIMAILISFVVLLLALFWSLRRRHFMS